MTPKLMDRLARLEAVQVAAGERIPTPPWLAGAYIEAIAIGLGGYPQAPKPAPLHLSDTLGDGFARGLGYAGEGDMEARLEADPDQWAERMRTAEASLIARYVTDPDGEGMGRSPAFQVMVGVLDEIAGAKASKALGEPDHWPSEHPQLDRAAKSIRRALAMFDIVSEEQVAEACGCH